MCLWSSRISCLKLLDLFSWMFFSSSSYLFLALSWFYVWALTKSLSSSYLACHLERFSLASRRRSLSVFSRRPIFSLLLLISSSLSLIFYLSSAIKLSFSAFSSSRPLILDSNCFVFSSWVFFTSSRSWIYKYLLCFLSWFLFRDHRRDWLPYLSRSEPHYQEFFWWCSVLLFPFQGPQSFDQGDLTI